MADPVIVDCPADVWTKVADNEMTGYIHIKDGIDLVWLQTYRNAGSAAPSDLSDAIAITDNTLRIDNTAGIDVYMQPRGSAGKVRADL